MRQPCILILFSLLLLGCQHTSTVSRAEFESLRTHCREPKVSVWYYMGSKDGFNFFRHRDLDGTRDYRVPEGEMKYPQTFPLTYNQRSWRVVSAGRN